MPSSASLGSDIQAAACSAACSHGHPWLWRQACCHGKGRPSLQPCQDAGMSMSVADRAKDEILVLLLVKNEAAPIKSTKAGDQGAVDDAIRASHQWRSILDDGLQACIMRRNLLLLKLQLSTGGYVVCQVQGYSFTAVVPAAGTTGAAGCNAGCCSGPASAVCA